MSLGKVLSWCAADTTTDAALGEVLVFVTEGTLDDDTAELGYQVVPSGRGRGVATTGARALVAHAFAARAAGGLGMRRLVAQTAEDNVASNTVLDRLGFTIWGRETRGRRAARRPGGRRPALGAAARLRSRIKSPDTVGWRPIAATRTPGLGASRPSVGVR